MHTRRYATASWTPVASSCSRTGVTPNCTMGYALAQQGGRFRPWAHQANQPVTSPWVGPNAFPETTDTGRRAKAYVGSVWAVVRSPAHHPASSGPSSCATPVLSCAAPIATAHGPIRAAAAADVAPRVLQNIPNLVPQESVRLNLLLLRGQDHARARKPGKTNMTRKDTRELGSNHRA